MCAASGHRDTWTAAGPAKNAGLKARRSSLLRRDLCHLNQENHGDAGQASRVNSADSRCAPGEIDHVRRQGPGREVPADRALATAEGRDYVLFYEYFHVDNGAGIGASDQTGWTGLVAPLLRLFAPEYSRRVIAGPAPEEEKVTG